MCVIVSVAVAASYAALMFKIPATPIAVAIVSVRFAVGDPGTVIEVNEDQEPVLTSVTLMSNDVVPEAFAID